MALKANSVLVEELRGVGDMSDALLELLEPIV